MTLVRAQRCSLKNFMCVALRKIREQRQLTQEQLATTLNCDRTYISALERGKKNINMRFLDRFVASLFPSNQAFIASIVEEFNKECSCRRKEGLCERGDQKDFWCTQGSNDFGKDT